MFGEIINSASAPQPTSISAGKLRISIARGFALKALFASSAHVAAADSSGTGRSSVSRNGAHRAWAPAAAAAAAAAVAAGPAAAAVVAAKPPLISSQTNTRDQEGGGRQKVSNDATDGASVKDAH